MTPLILSLGALAIVSTLLIFAIMGWRKEAALLRAKVSRLRRTLRANELEILMQSRDQGISHYKKGKG